jgi:hypothetical protein
MDKQNQLTEQESLRIISEMMLSVRKEFYDTGISALMWGSTVTFCGIFSFLGIYYKWDFHFLNVWNLTFIALIPQIWISIKERKSRKAKERIDAVGAVWIVFALVMFGLVLYTATNKVESNSSLFLLAYTVPTLTTGIVRKFNAMLYGAIIGYGCFVVSCYTPIKVDMLLHSLSASSCWLIPGIILHQRYKKSRTSNV